MNTGTILRTILVIATCLNTALMATDLTGFSNATVEAVYKIASIVLNFIIVAIATYFNNDFTEVAAKHTGAMRLEKDQMYGIITGEDFTDDPYEEEDGIPAGGGGEEIDDGPEDDADEEGSEE